MPNPNFNYRGLPNYGYPNRNENIGLLIGTLLGAGLGAAGGENTADALLRGGAGGIASYGSGLRGIQDYNTDAFKQQTIADQLLYEPREQERAEKRLAMDREQFEMNKIMYPARQRYMESQSAYMDKRAEDPSKFWKPTSVDYANKAAQGDKEAELTMKLLRPGAIKNTDQGIKYFNPIDMLLSGQEGVVDTGYTQKKEISDKGVDDISTMQTVLQTTNDLKNLSNKVTTGPLAGRLNQLGANWFNGLTSDEQIAFDTATQQAFNIMGKLRAGSAWTEAEIQRLERELPQTTMPINTYMGRLKRFELLANRMLGNKVGTYKQANYNVSGFDNKMPVSNSAQLPIQTDNIQSQNVGDPIQKFNNDPNMKGMQLGKQTDQGYEVIKDGMIIGYYE